MHFYEKEYDSYYRPQVLSNESDQRYNIIRQICTRLEEQKLMHNKNPFLILVLEWAGHWMGSEKSISLF